MPWWGPSKDPKPKQDPKQSASANSSSFDPESSRTDRNFPRDCRLLSTRPTPTAASLMTCAKDSESARSSSGDGRICKVLIEDGQCSAIDR